MAKILNNNKNHLKNNLHEKRIEIYKKYTIVATYTASLFLIYFILDTLKNNTSFYNLSELTNLFITFLSATLLMRNTYGQNLSNYVCSDTDYKKIKAGLVGENKSMKLFKKLPDNFSVINDLKVTDNEGNSSQIDTVIVSDNGIFIVEIKNIKGKLIGNASDKNLKVVKTGRKGGQYISNNNLYNPIKQVNTHTYRLAKYLRENNLNYKIKSCVLLINKEGRSSVENISETPIFTATSNGLNNFGQWINSNEYTINSNDKTKIENLLKECII